MVCSSASDVLAEFPVTLEEDEKYVVMATGTGSFQFDSNVNDAIGFTRNFNACSDRRVNDDNVDLAVYHGSTDAPAVDVLTGGATLIDD